MQCTSKQESGNISNNILLYRVRRHCWDEIRGTHSLTWLKKSMKSKNPTNVPCHSTDSILIGIRIRWHQRTLGNWAHRIYRGQNCWGDVWLKYQGLIHKIIRLESWNCFKLDVSRILYLLYKIICLINRWRNKDWESWFQGH